MVNLLGVPTIIGSIYLGEAAFFLFVWIISILGSLEYRKIVDKKEDFLSRYILIGFISAILFGYKNNLDISFILIIIICIMMIELFRFRKKPLYYISTTIFGVLWIGLMLGSLIPLRDLDIIGFEVVVMIFVSVWCCDSFAFIAGKYFGKKKILPSISPKKTWLGTLTGLFAGIFAVFIFYFYGESFGFNFFTFKSIFNLTNILCLGIIFGGIGQLGDFFESLLKREAGIKDSSKILKGHGGILDRFDSIMFVAPLTYIYLEFIF